MSKPKLFVKEGCPWCIDALSYFKSKSIDLEILGEEIREKVKKKYNINLDWELLRIGKFKKI